MEENQIQTNLENVSVEVSEPASADNSELQTDRTYSEAQDTGFPQGQSSLQDPTGDLILGKFKSVDELSKAYEELQRHQGLCSDELGSLRSELASLNNFKQIMERFDTAKNSYLSVIARDKGKYDTPEYFRDPTFREIYREALGAFGENLDTDRFVNLLESYVSARIFANDRKKAAQNETQKVLDSMMYSKNPKSSITPPKKRFDEMTEKEIDELLDRLI